MQISKRTFLLSVMGIFWGIILLSMLTGGWQAKTTEDQVVVETAADLKGWMKVEEVLNYLNMTKEEMREILKIKGEIDPKQKFKDLASENGKTADEYKDILEKYKENKDVGQGEEFEVKEVDNADNKENIPSSVKEAENSEIKGYMTFKNISDKFKIPVKEIYKKLDIPEEQDANVPMKDLTSKYNFEVQQVRDFVEQYKKN